MITQAYLDGYMNKEAIFPGAGPVKQLQDTKQTFATNSVVSGNKLSNIPSVTKTGIGAFDVNKLTKRIGGKKPIVNKGASLGFNLKQDAFKTLKVTNLRSNNVR